MTGLETFFETGEHRWVWCDGCGSTSRAEADLYAVSTDDVRWVRLLSHCPRCAEQARRSAA
jgi:hypothetical protein